MANFVRTEEEFKSFTYKKKMYDKGYFTILGKEEARELLRQQSDVAEGCLGIYELAEIAANGGCLILDNDLNEIGEIVAVRR